MALPALVGLALNILPGLLGSVVNDKAGEVAGQIADVVKSVTGTDDRDEAEAILARDPAKLLELKSKLLDIQDRENERRHQERLAEIKDTADARQAFKSDGKVFWLGVCVLLTFAVVVAGACYGAFVLLTEGITIKDVGVVAAVFGFLGTLVGYVAANAQQVISYFFGSSKGSKDKSDSLASSLENMAKAAVRK